MRIRVVATMAAALVLHALGWWLPVIRSYRGWQAFRVALSPLVPYQHLRVPNALLGVLAAGSALTNVAFIAAVLLLARPARGPTSVRAVLVVIAAAALLNLHWPLSVGERRSELALGYYVWVASFLALALAAFLDLEAPPERRSR